MEQFKAHIIRGHTHTHTVGARRDSCRDVEADTDRNSSEIEIQLQIQIGHRHVYIHIWYMVYGRISGMLNSRVASIKLRAMWFSKQNTPGELRRERGSSHSLLVFSFRVF